MADNKIVSFFQIFWKGIVCCFQWLKLALKLSSISMSTAHLPLWESGIWLYILYRAKSGSERLDGGSGDGVYRRRGLYVRGRLASSFSNCSLCKRNSSFSKRIMLLFGITQLCIFKKTNKTKNEINQQVLNLLMVVYFQSSEP